MKKFVSGIILFSAFSVNSYAQEAKTVVKKKVDKTAAVKSNIKEDKDSKVIASAAREKTIAQKTTDSPDVAAFKAAEAAEKEKNTKPKTKGE